MTLRPWTTGLAVLACALAAPQLAAQTTPTAPVDQQPPPMPTAIPAPAPASAEPPPAAKAPAGQTAEGAQRFFAALVKKGNAQAWFVDAQGRTNPVRGKAVRTSTHVGIVSDDEQRSERVVEKQLSAFAVSSIDTQGPAGQRDACLTRIAQWEVREPLTETRSWHDVDSGILIDTAIVHKETTGYELPAELAGPHWIDWRNVKLARATNGSAMTASFKEKNFVAHLAFTGETDLIDRVEYAMKFLKMACDDTAATGF